MADPSPRNSGHDPKNSTPLNGNLGEAEYRFPATVAQLGFWFLDRLEPGNPAWNIAVRFRIRGPLEVSTLERALNEIVRRHEILRTTFAPVDGDPMQFIHSTGLIPVPVEDLSALPAHARDQEEERLTIADGSLSFDLKAGPLLRARLLRLCKDDHMLLVTVHHIVCDGWSIGILSDELASNYSDFAAGRAPTLPELPLQFADFTIWQNARNSQPVMDEHRNYWKTKLARLPPLEIPTDHPRPPVKTHNGYILSTLIPVPVTDDLAEFSREQGVTFYATALSALKMLVQHYVRHNDIYVGTLVAGRDRVEVEPLIGLFINSIVLRTDLSGDPTFPELLERVRHTLDEGIMHQDLHFQQVVEVVRPKRDSSRPVMYGINFIYQRDFVKPLEFAGLTMVPYPSKSPGAIYDLNFFMVQRADGWRLSCEYNYDLYNAESVNRMIGQLRNLFEEIARNPQRRLSEFPFPEEAGEPIPSGAPRRDVAFDHLQPQRPSGQC